jgi:hypothetical protein
MTTKELAEITLKHIDVSLDILREKIEDSRLTTDQWLTILMWIDELTQKSAMYMKRLEKYDDAIQATREEIL